MVMLAESISDSYNANTFKEYDTFKVGRVVWFNQFPTKERAIR